MNRNPHDLFDRENLTLVATCANPSAELEAMPSNRSNKEGSMQPNAFELELRKLVQRRLLGELSFEEFARLNLELYQRYGRKGYDTEQYEKDLREYRQRQMRLSRRKAIDSALLQIRPDRPKSA